MLSLLVDALTVAAPSDDASNLSEPLPPARGGGVLPLAVGREPLAADQPLWLPDLGQLRGGGPPSSGKGGQGWVSLAAVDPREGVAVGVAVEVLKGLPARAPLSGPVTTDGAVGVLAAKTGSLLLLPLWLLVLALKLIETVQSPVLVLLLYIFLLDLFLHEGGVLL